MFTIAYSLHRIAPPTVVWGTRIVTTQLAGSPPLTDPAHGPARPALRFLLLAHNRYRDYRCYSKYAVANRRHQVPASLKIGGLAAAVALTAALTSCSTGGGSSSSSSVSSSSSPASASSLKQAQHEHGLVIYANAPTQ